MWLVLLVVFVFLVLLGAIPVWLQRCIAQLLHLVRNKAPRKMELTHIHDRLYMGRVPTSAEDYRVLREQYGVTGVVCLLEPREVLCNAKDVQEIRVPVPDFFAPSAAQLEECHRWMDRHLHDHAGNLYIHCKAGKGRSAVVVVTFLMRTLGWSAEQAYEHVRSQRRIANLRALAGLRSQWRAIKSYS